MFLTAHSPVCVSGDGHNHRLWRQGAPDVDREDHRIVFLRLRHLLLRPAGGECGRVPRQDDPIPLMAEM